MNVRFVGGIEEGWGMCWLVLCWGVCWCGDMGGIDRYGSITATVQAKDGVFWLWLDWILGNANGG